MKRQGLGILIIVAVVLVFSATATPWSIETHKLLTQRAAEHSRSNTSNYLQRIGLTGLKQDLRLGNETRSIELWIQHGADLEDAGTWVEYIANLGRANNHFHNPLQDWWSAGLNDPVLGLPFTGASSVLWAQSREAQLHWAGGRGGEWDWSWQTLRAHYLQALTAATPAQRQAYFARIFRGLGHQMHLIQDAAQPDHVRNDNHFEDALFKKSWWGSFYFEEWATQSVEFINAMARVPIFPAVPLYISRGFAPITQLIDAEEYTGGNPSDSLSQGIAEYTNANFFSDDTIFAAETYPVGHRHHFPYPKQSSTNVQDYLDQQLLPQTIVARDGVPDTGFWIAKQRDGVSMVYFVKPTYFTTDIYKAEKQRGSSGVVYQRTFYRDEECHKDYARHLIPRAVGYSAALLDYFFRGKLVLEQSSTGSGFVVVNRGDEDMAGTFALYYDNIVGRRQVLWSDAFVLGADGSGTHRSKPINYTPPSDASTPGEYMLVFQGRLGAEFGAVVGSIVTAQTVVFWPLAFPLSGVHGGANRVFESTIVTPDGFPTSGMMAVEPPRIAHGGASFPGGSVLLSMFIDGQPLITSQAVPYDFFHTYQEFIETGLPASGVHRFTMLLQSMTDDLILMNAGFGFRVKISTPR
jgi:hypothetical protein